MLAGGVIEAWSVALSDLPEPIVQSAGIRLSRIFVLQLTNLDSTISVNLYMSECTRRLMKMIATLVQRI